MTSKVEPGLEDALRAGPLEVRVAGHIAYADGRPLLLTPRELAVLTVLVRSADAVVTRDELYAQVWGHRRAPRDRSVDVYVRRLRAKLREALPGWTFIHTHFSFGYRLSAQRSQDLHHSATDG